MKIDLDDPTALALLASDALAAVGLDHALYGGLLLASYGEPRETRDADLAVVDAGASVARDALVVAGLSVAVSFEDVRFGGLMLSRLAVFGGAATGLNTVDLVRPRSDRYARAVLARAVEAPLRNRPIRVVAPEDFVLMKVLSTRDRDLDDAASVLRRSADIVDHATISDELRLLEGELPDADVGGRLAEIYRRSR